VIALFHHGAASTGNLIGGGAVPGNHIAQKRSLHNLLDN
jgi:hypothetical protein